MAAADQESPMSTDLSPGNERYIEDAIARGVFESREQALDAAVELLKRRQEGVGEPRPLNDDEFEATMDELAGMGAQYNLPSLPDAAITREGIYGGHPHL
jgi:Arc/MetJ-type ribon-helix-helix transcriptional regulator